MIGWGCKVFDRADAQQAMEALDTMVNNDAKEPSSRVGMIRLYCVHPDHTDHKVVWDPAHHGRAICPDCAAVYVVTSEKPPAPGK